MKRPVWKWYVPAYFFTGGMAAGTAVLAAGARRRGLPALARRSRATTVAAMGVSTGLLIADLGRPARFLNMLRVAKVTSPLSVGTWVLSAFTSSAAATVAVPALDVVPAALAPMMATYTAVVLADTAVPAWNVPRRELPFVFTAGALASAGGVGCVLAGPDEMDPARKMAVLGAVGKLVASEVMVERHPDVADAYRQGRAARFGRRARWCSGAGALLLVVSPRRSLTRLGAVLVVAGSLFERFRVFEAGMQSADDPAFTVGPQRTRADRGGSYAITT